MVTSSLPKRTLSLGHRLELRLNLENTDKYNAEIESILIPNSFLKGLRFLGSIPAMPRALNSQGDWVFEFKRSIAPQGMEELIFSFDTISSGTFTGAGVVQTNDESHDFDLNLTVAGVNPAGWKPGAAKQAPDEVNDDPNWLSVVKIDAMAEQDGERTRVWTGTGTIISPDGLILTAADLVLSDRYFQVTDLIVSLTVNNEAEAVPTYQASIVQADFELGIAIIKPHATLDGKALDYALLDLPVIPLGNSPTFERGAELLVLGYPATESDETLQESTVIVNDFGSEFPFGEDVLIHAERAIGAGFAGAPALNEAGELVAVPIHKSPVTYNPNTADCESIVEAYRDGRVDMLDPCHRVKMPIDTLRPLHLLHPMIEAAQRGEIKIVSSAHGEGLLKRPAKLLDLDEFSDNRNQWKMDSAAVVAQDQSIRDGMFFFSLNEAMNALLAQVDYAYEDMLIESDVLVVSPSFRGEFGLICGINGDDKTVFALSENGYYAIWTIREHEMAYLRHWYYSPLVDTEKILHISAHCSLEGHEFAVNGQVLARVFDPDFKPGMVGLYAASYDKAGLMVAFDNFSVSLME